MQCEWHHWRQFLRLHVASSGATKDSTLLFPIFAVVLGKTCQSLLCGNSVELTFKKLWLNDYQKKKNKNTGWMILLAHFGLLQIYQYRRICCPICADIKNFYIICRKRCLGRFLIIKFPMKFIVLIHWCPSRQQSLLFNCKISCLHFILPYICISPQNWYCCSSSVRIRNRVYSSSAPSFCSFHDWSFPLKWSPSCHTW